MYFSTFASHDVYISERKWVDLPSRLENVQDIKHLLKSLTTISCQSASGAACEAESMADPKRGGGGPGGPHPPPPFFANQNFFYEKTLKITNGK
jgi:hypothetical protein